ncbi:MAG TPA: hypothetical protein VFV81_00900 [Verrucomicrobiae bacterium]|nr:hypothetical protein [Verrucomicrobiae bacterium]
MKTLPPLQNVRFVSCADGRRLLNHFAAGDIHAPLMKYLFSTRRGIFRGKIPLRQNQHNNDLEERTRPAPNQ